MNDAARSLTRRTITRVTLRSQITPDYSIEPFSRGPAPAPQRGVGNLLMGLIRPAIYVDTPVGVVKAEPWGAPTRNYLPALIVLGGVGVLAVLGAAYALGARGR